MASVETKRGERRALLGKRNIVVLALATACIVAGYVTLSSGAASLAAVLLVLGYCVLFPVAIAL
ncbi:MAG: hypothetical protein HOP28_01450 [Gemmatimonadales bacterium]|nr:hypothetical protein [Gemmatimonadales bacterium]